MASQAIRIWICVALAIGVIPAGAANDTARFSGKWKTSFPYNGKTVTMASIHKGREFKDYLLVPNGAVLAGQGTFSAVDGKWTARADSPNNSGTYYFTSSDTVVCANASGQTVVWQRDDTPLPPVAPTDHELMEKYRKAAAAGDAVAMNSIGLMYERPRRGAGLSAGNGLVSQSRRGRKRGCHAQTSASCIGMGMASRWITISLSTGAGKRRQGVMNGRRSG